jgi:hypothetical protein
MKHMNFGRAQRGLFAVSVCLLLTPLTAKADLLVYEPFNYGANLNLNGLPASGLNLTGGYVTSSLQDLVISDPGLTYGNLTGNLPPVMGNRLSDNDGVGPGVVTVSVNQDVTINSGESLFFSALFTFDDSQNGNRRASVHLQNDATGDELIFGQPGVGVGAVRIEADTAATGGLIADGADNAFIDGHTLLLIGRYQNSASPGGDTLELLGYDTANAAALPAAFNFADPAAAFAFSLTGVTIDFTTISSLRFEVRGDNNNFIDELRIGNTYGDLLPTANGTTAPEPASGSALLGGLSLLLLARRRKQRTLRRT